MTTPRTKARRKTRSIKDGGLNIFTTLHTVGGAIVNLDEYHCDFGEGPYSHKFDDVNIHPVETAPVIVSTLAHGHIALNIGDVTVFLTAAQVAAVQDAIAGAR